MAKKKPSKAEKLKDMPIQDGKFTLGDAISAVFKHGGKPMVPKKKAAKKKAKK